MRTFWNDSMVMLVWPTVAAKSRRLSSHFPRDNAGGDEAERREDEGDEGEFPVDHEHEIREKMMVLGSLTRSERPSLRKLLSATPSISMRR